MKMVVSPIDGTEIRRTLTFTSVEDIAANLAADEKAHLVPQDVGLIDDSKLHVVDNVLMIKPGVTEPVQHAGERCLPHDFRFFG